MTYRTQNRAHCILLFLVAVAGLAAVLLASPDRYLALGTLAAGAFLEFALIIAATTWHWTRPHGPRKSEDRHGLPRRLRRS